MSHPPSGREQEIYRGNARLSTAASDRTRLVRFATDWRFAIRVVRYLLGLAVPMDTEDRRVLERIIFPHFTALPDLRSVLFVGCDWYTKHYGAAFFSTQEFWTIDSSASARKFAGRRHLVAPLEELPAHFAEGYFDLIICNGVYGFGLDSLTQCEQAFAACHARLRSGGYFILGWDDIPARTPVPLADVSSLRLFRQFTFPPLGTWRYLTETPYRHTYDFYRK
jgi:SAM-dependent methyltransferase